MSHPANPPVVEDGQRPADRWADTDEEAIILAYASPWKTYRSRESGDLFAHEHDDCECLSFLYPEVVEKVEAQATTPTTTYEVDGSIYESLDAARQHLNHLALADLPYRVELVEVSTTYRTLYHTAGGKGQGA